MSISANVTVSKTSIHFIRGKQVMLDNSISDCFQVPVKRINEQVKRNKARFPEEFCFQLTQNEWQLLKSQIATSNGTRGGKVKSPWAFTEHGVAMIATLLNSPQAAKLSIEIINLFIQARKTGFQFSALEQKYERLKQIQADQSQEIAKIWNQLENGNIQKSQGIFFNNQIFDAYIFSSDLIKSAKKSVVLIDNYLDETTLIQLSKRNARVACTVYTEKITEQLRLDFAKHNSQYPLIDLRTLKHVHDRFLIIDNKELYHLGASLKDLGKRWFAFSRIDGFLKEVQARLK
jgi:hypothetical protein